MIAAEAQGAWRELERQLRPFVGRRVAEADVDDVVQDVFVRILRGVGDLRDEQRFGPWVYRVARSAIVDHLRVRARHPLADDLRDEAVLPIDDPRDAEQVVAAYAAYLVATLPSPYREAITLTELEGVTQREAAEMLGVSLTAMKSRVQRGRQKVRAAIEACCHIALDARHRVVGCVPRTKAETGCDC